MAPHLLRIAAEGPRLGAWFAGGILLLSCLVVGLEVILRKTTGVTLGSVDELVGYALAFSAAWGLSYALITRNHIRIDALYERLPLAMRAALDIANLLCLILFFGMLAWYGWQMTEMSFVFGSRSMSPMKTPLVIPQTIWMLGISFFLFVALLHLTRCLRYFISGNFAGIQRVAGSKSASDEVREEMADAESLVKNAERT